MPMNGEYGREEFLARADSLLAQGSYEEALALSKERLSIFPGDPDATMVVCQAALGRDDLDEAQSALKSLEKVNLRLARIYKAMGDACLARGLSREALDYFQKGMILIPEAAEADRMSRAMADALGAFNEGPGREKADRVDRAAPIPDFYTLTMADLYLKQGHLELALEVLQAMQRQEPENEAVAERLREVAARMQAEGKVPESSGNAVAEELSRWLTNISRIKSNGKQASQDP